MQTDKPRLRTDTSVHFRHCELHAYATTDALPSDPEDRYIVLHLSDRKWPCGQGPVLYLTVEQADKIVNELTRITNEITGYGPADVASPITFAVPESEYERRENLL